MEFAYHVDGQIEDVDAGRSESAGWGPRYVVLSSVYDNNLS